jgi:hypothetical protein
MIPVAQNPEPIIRAAQTPEPIIRAAQKPRANHSGGYAVGTLLSNCGPLSGDPQVRIDLCDRRSLRSSTVVYLSVHLQTGKFKNLEGAHLEHPILESPPRFGQRTDRETLERPSFGYFL